MSRNLQVALRVARETDHEVAFSETGGAAGWALFAVGVGILATGLAQSLIERAIKLGPLLPGTVLTVLGFVMICPVSKLTLQLDNGTYTRKEGFRFSPRCTQGMLSEIKGITLTSETEVSRTGERPVWSIFISFHSGEDFCVADSEPDEPKAYEAAHHLANVLRVPVLDSPGKDPTSNDS